MARKRTAQSPPAVAIDYSQQLAEIRARPPAPTTSVPWQSGDIGWAVRIVKRIEAGEHVPPIAQEFARMALKRERQPGDDDEGLPEV